MCGECRCISPSAGQEERERMLGRTEDKQEEVEEVREMGHHVTEMENESAISPERWKEMNHCISWSQNTSKYSQYPLHRVLVAA